MIKKFGMPLVLMLCALSIPAAQPQQDAVQPAFKTSAAENHPGGNSGEKRHRHPRRHKKRGRAMPLRNTESKPVNNPPTSPADRQPAHRNPWTERPLKPEQPEKPADKPAKDNP